MSAEGPGSQAVVFIVAYIGTLATILMLCGFVGNYLDRITTAEEKKRVTTFLHNAGWQRTVRQWPDVFILTFDRVFGERHLSFRCFARSCLASIAAIVIMYGIYFAVRPVGFEVMRDYIWQYPGRRPLFLVSVLLVWPVLINMLPDYLSLLQTRIVLGFMRDARSSRRIGGLLVADLVLTAWVAFTALAVGSFLYGYYAPQHPGGDTAFFVAALLAAESVLWGPLLHGNLAATGGAPVGVYFYSTFFTSLWIWLFILSVIGTRVVLIMARPGGWLLRRVDVVGAPYGGLALVVMMYVALGGVIGGIITVAVSN